VGAYASNAIDHLAATYLVSYCKPFPSLFHDQPFYENSISTVKTEPGAPGEPPGVPALVDTNCTIPELKEILVSKAYCTVVAASTGKTTRGCVVPNVTPPVLDASNKAKKHFVVFAALLILICCIVSEEPETKTKLFVAAVSTDLELEICVFIVLTTAAIIHPQKQYNLEQLDCHHR
jgi:hypothetical protein